MLNENSPNLKEQIPISLPESCDDAQPWFKRIESKKQIRLERITPYLRSKLLEGNRLTGESKKEQASWMIIIKLAPFYPNTDMAKIA